MSAREIPWPLVICVTEYGLGRMSQLTTSALSAIHVLLLNVIIYILSLKFFVFKLLAAPAMAGSLTNPNGHSFSHLSAGCYDGWFMGLDKTQEDTYEIRR